MITPEEMDNWKMTYDDPYDGAPVVDDAYKQDFSAKYARRSDDRGVMSMVREFADVMGQKPNALLALDLVYEEWAEFRDAEHPLDDIKELADLVYVLYGYANVMGYDLDEALRRVHENNCTRGTHDDGKIYYHPNGKVKKNPNTPKIDLSDLV